MNKPDWSEHAPEWAKFLAQDYDGEWWFYDSEPRATGLIWSHSGRCERASVPNENHYWTDTLERRP